MFSICSGAVVLGIASMHYIGGATRVFWGFMLFDAALLGFVWSALRSKGVFGSRGYGALRTDDEKGFRRFFYGVLVLLLLAQLMGVAGTVVNLITSRPVQ